MRQNIFCVQPRLIAVYAAGCWLLYSGVEIGGQTGSDNSASTRLPQQRQVSRRDIESSAHFASIGVKSIVLSASSTLSIARELHLSDEQQRLLDQLHALTCASIRRAILRAADDLDESPDLARAELAKSGAVVRDVIQHAEKIATTAILTRKQAERLQQIAWHMQGPRALMEDEVSEKLALTKQQKEQIRRLGDRVSTLHTSATESGGGPGGASSPQARPERDFPKLIMETEAEMENVLNPAQRKKWAELKGPKFDLRQTDPK